MADSMHLGSTESTTSCVCWHSSLCSRDRQFLIWCAFYFQKRISDSCLLESFIRTVILPDKDINRPPHIATTAAHRTTSWIMALATPRTVPYCQPRGRTDDCFSLGSGGRCRTVMEPALLHGGHCTVDSVQQQLHLVDNFLILDRKNNVDDLATVSHNYYSYQVRRISVLVEEEQPSRSSHFIHARN